MTKSDRNGQFAPGDSVRLLVGVYSTPVLTGWTTPVILGRFLMPSERLRFVRHREELPGSTEVLTPDGATWYVATGFLAHARPETGATK